MDTEDRLERWRDADTWPAERSLAAMLDSQMAAFGAVRNALPALARAAEAAAERLGRGGRLVYAGAGASGRLAVQDGVELHPTFGWPRERLCYLIAGGEAALVRSIEGAEDDVAAAVAAVDGAGARRGATWSWRSPRRVAPRSPARVQRRARAAGALTIGLANNPGTPLLEEAEIPVLLATGPEFLAGSTRMAAGTAQKIALNLLVDPDHDGARPGLPGLHGRRGPDQRQAGGARQGHRPGADRLRPCGSGSALGARRR